jgi:hypothetical protein
MNKILVPIKDFSALSLSASYFAVEFAKRTSQTKILFLIFSKSGTKDNKGGPALISDNPWQRRFDNLVQQALGEKINLALHYSEEDYIKDIPRFVRDHHIAELIIALPPGQDEVSNEVRQDIQKLRGKVECQLVTVRVREEEDLFPPDGRKRPD